MRKTKFYLVTLLFVLGIIFMVNAQEVPTRDKIDDKYKWNLTDLYKSNLEFEKDFKAILEISDKFISHKNNITKTSKNLLNALNDYNEMWRRFSRVI